MKLIPLLLLTSTLVHAQEPPAAPKPSSPPPALPDERPLPPRTSIPQAPTNPKEAAMEKLFGTMGTKEFAAALQEAQKTDIHPQILLEARFLHLVDLRDNAKLAAMAPEFVEKQDTFDPDTSEIFSVKEDWLAVVRYTQALAALEKDDKASFKKHITEAFWLSPRQAQAFAPHINQLRLDEAMQKVTIDPTRTLKAQDGGKPTTLGELMKGRKATVIHLWSPMSQEVQMNLPDFVLTTQSCKTQNIAVISVLIGQYPNILEEAETLRKDDAKKAWCTWLVDTNKNSLATLFRVTNIPTMVIVSPEGKILFNGHPSNKKFWQTIQKIAPEFKRPNNTNQPNAQQSGHTHDNE